MKRKLLRTLKWGGLAVLCLLVVGTLAFNIVMREPKQADAPGVLSINNPSPAMGDIFAYAVAPYGNDVLVGGVSDSTGATGAGSAYLFDSASGALLRTLHNPTPEKYDYFGRAVAAWGSNIVVAAYRDNTGAEDAGSVYIFNGHSGELLRSLHNPAPGVKAYFGRSLAVLDDTLIVGADGDSTQAHAAGAVYLFEAASGQLRQTLLNPTPEEEDQFGLSLAVWGQDIVVGAIGDNSGAPRAGAVYVFDGHTGALRLTLTNPDPVEDGNFGYAVTVIDDAVVVGAIGNNSVAPAAGNVYVFDAHSGALLRAINNPSPDKGDNFGYAVGHFQGDILVGAIGDNSGAKWAGTVYLFDHASGALRLTLPNPTPKFFDSFGWSLAEAGDRIVVGAIGDKVGAPSAGSAYVFDAAHWLQTAGR